MPIARPAALLISLVVAAVTMLGCGGGGDGSAATTGASAVPGHASAGLAKTVYARQAEAVCKRGVARIKSLGRRLPEILSSASSPQSGITEGLVAPGIAILSREAESLRGLGPPPASPALETYLGLFDPIIELARQRFQAGAEDPERGRQLELMIASLNSEQSAAARQFGLHACGLEFNTALGG